MASNSDTQKPEAYVLIKGKHAGFDSDGTAKVFSVGEQIQLTPQQALSFHGKVKAVRELRAEQKVQEELADEVASHLLQPYAPTESVNPDTQELADQKDQASQEAMLRDVASGAPGESQSEPDPAKIKADPKAPVQPVKPVTPVAPVKK